MPADGTKKGHRTANTMEGRWETLEEVTAVVVRLGHSSRLPLGQFYIAWIGTDRVWASVHAKEPTISAGPAKLRHEGL